MPRLVETLEKLVKMEREAYTLRSDQEVAEANSLGTLIQGIQQTAQRSTLPIAERLS